MDKGRFVAIFGAPRSAVDDHTAARALAAIGSNLPNQVPEQEEVLLVADTTSDSGASTFVSNSRYIGLGEVRLDNREELRRILNTENYGCSESTSDLEIVVLLVGHFGLAVVRLFLGDFAFAVYDKLLRIVIIARDVFGVKPLFYALGPTTLRVSSRAALLSEGGYNLQFFAHFLTGHLTSSEDSVYPGVARLLPGTVAQWSANNFRRTTYWRWTDVTPLKISPDDASANLATQLEDAVRTRATSDSPVYAELSGGLDSSSIVSVAHLLAVKHNSKPLAGTITYVDSLGDGDERYYVDQLLSQIAVPNKQIWDDWAWRDDGEGAPLWDEPRTDFPFYAHHRRMRGVVTEAGGRVLLSGEGADHYLQGQAYYIADMLANGELRVALRAIMENAIATGKSPKTVAWTFGIHPLLPLKLRDASRSRRACIPKWFERDFVRRHEIQRRARPLAMKANRECSRHLSVLINALGHVSNLIPYGEAASAVETRYPFLARPVVEGVLAVDPLVQSSARVTKPLLRAAMRGVLPEAIRMRQTKGSATARLLWSLTQERARLGQMLRDPILAQLGCVNASSLRSAYEEARVGRVDTLRYVYSALALETWLAVREGRWDDFGRTKGMSIARSA